MHEALFVIDDGIWLIVERKTSSRLERLPRNNLLLAHLLDVLKRNLLLRDATPGHVVVGDHAHINVSSPRLHDPAFLPTLVDVSGNSYVGRTRAEPILEVLKIVHHFLWISGIWCLRVPIRRGLVCIPDLWRQSVGRLLKLGFLLEFFGQRLQSAGIKVRALGLLDELF